MFRNDGSDPRQLEGSLPKNEKTHAPPNAEPAYTSHAPILIASNAAFDSQAVSNGWSGDGLTPETAYVIEGYSITSTADGGGWAAPIFITGTTRYFIIQNNLLAGVSDQAEGIYLENLQHGTILLNDIHSARHGVFVRSCADVSVLNNTIWDSSQSGVRVRASSSNINVSCNTLYDNTYQSIWLDEDTSNIDVTHNTIYGSNENGIFLDGRISSCGYNNIAFNTISGCQDGVLLYGNTPGIMVMENDLHNNTISNCSGSGIAIRGEASVKNRVTGNTIYDNTGHGVYLAELTEANNVTENGIENCTGYGIYCKGLDGKNRVYDNGIADSTIGVLIEDVVGLEVFLNTLDSNGYGIYLKTGSSGNNITTNQVCNCIHTGLVVESSDDNMFSHNDLFKSGLDGVLLNKSDNNDFQGITTRNSTQHGIAVVDSDGNTFNQSIVYGNGDDGVHFGGSSALNNLTSSLISFNRLGAELVGNSMGNRLRNSTLLNNTEYGLVLNGSSTLNEGKWNAFFSNNKNSGSQAYDGGSSNPISYNFWDEWTSPDAEPDGIVDVPYAIDGSAENEDPYPLAIPSIGTTVHYLLPISIISPSEEGYLYGDLTVEWSSTYDTLGHTVNYTLYYSPTSSVGWTVIADDLHTTSYVWDTTMVPEGEYLLRVVANCSEELSVECTSTAFTVREHVLSEPTLGYPNGGELINQTATITWSTSVDSWDHDVDYTIEYSTNGVDWTLIAEDLVSTSLLWNTTELPRVSGYTIRVTADCSEGLTAIDTSDNSFTLNPHSVSVPEILSPVSGSNVSGQIQIEWTSSVDSWSHEVNYDAYYSNNSGGIWVEIAIGLSDTSCPWDTEALTPGSEYIIRVRAYCLDGAESIGTSDAFTIESPTTTTTTTTTMTTTTSTTSTTTTSTTTTGTTSTTGTGPPTDMGLIYIFLIALGAVGVVIIILVLRHRRIIG